MPTFPTLCTSEKLVQVPNKSRFNLSHLFPLYVNVPHTFQNEAVRTTREEKADSKGHTKQVQSPASNCRSEGTGPRHSQFGRDN